MQSVYNYNVNLQNMYKLFSIRRISLRKSNYLKIIPMHMMIREIIQGR